jgi:oligopeptide transport system permease protein
MTALILRRLAQLPLILVTVYVVSAFLLWAKPGDPLSTGPKPPSPAARKAMELRYGMDKPAWVRFGLIYPRQLVVEGTLPSFQYMDWTVPEIIAMSFPVSFQLGLFSLILALLGGTGAGMVSAIRRNTWLDHLSLGIALIGISLPVFVIAEVGLMVLSVWWGVLPVGGWGRPSQLILPGVTLSLPFMAYMARLMRAAMLDVLDSDFIRTAKAKGLSGRVVVLKHAFKNSFLPILSFLGPAAAGIFTGSFVVEKIFNIPGLGTHFVNSVLNGDQTLALGVVLLYSTMLVVFNLLVDIGYAAVDPRIRVGEG